ncbi:MAG TPA: nuclear transport factor 2 family protein [Gemmatimonadales bacterium]
MNPSLTACLLVLGIVGCAADRGADKVVRDFLTARNRYDLRAVSDLVTEDVVMRDPLALPSGGRKAVLARVRWDSVLSSQWRWTGTTVHGDTVTFRRLAETSTWHQILGIGLVERDTTRFVVRAGRVSEIVLGGLDVASETRLRAALDDFLPWALHEFPERLARTRPDGLFDPDPRRGADWLSLIRIWSDSAK